YVPPRRRPPTSTLFPYTTLFRSSVAEVKTAFHNLNVVDIPFNAQMPNTTLHWFVADKKQAAVIEVIQGKVKITDNPANVLTNSPDRKSTRLNSSHVSISYAVFCL